MKSNYKSKLFIIIIILFIVILLFNQLFGFSSATYYTSVKEYNDNNTNEFYDFYHPDHYFNNSKKTKISSMNKIKIYYTNNSETNYSIAFRNISDIIEISFMFNKEEKFQEDTTNINYKGHQFYIDDQSPDLYVYYVLPDSYIRLEVVDYLNSSIDINTIKTNIYELIIDSLKINKRN